LALTIRLLAAALGLLLAACPALEAAAALLVREGPHPAVPDRRYAVLANAAEGRPAPREAVEAEIAHLEARLPRLRELRGAVYLPPAGPEGLGGLAVRDPAGMWAAVYPPGGVFYETGVGTVTEEVCASVVLAAYPHPAGAVEVAGTVCLPWEEAAARYAAAHEVGHLARWAFVPDAALREYAARRLGRAADLAEAEEVFAEDFRALFGSPEARIAGPKSPPAPPLSGPRRLEARAWFLRWLGPPAER